MRIINDINKSITKRIIASIIEIFPDAKGLLAVRLTFLSILISIKSLMIHPALRIKKAPKAKNTNHLICLERLSKSIARANQQGHIKSKKPIGLLNRIKLRNELILLGMFFSDIV